jgi:hypothetical protein
MSHIQVALYLLALLSIYAIAVGSLLGAACP